MDRQLLKNILLDYQREVERYEVVTRNIDMESFGCYVIVGVRRAGKSFLLYQRMQQLLKEGHTWADMLYVNFEDDRLEGFTSADFDALLDCHMETYGKRPIMFLDEIQDIDGWEKFARRLADTKYQVYITGSNAKMLSREIAATLGGRYLTIEVYPFSFKEYLDYHHTPYDELSMLTSESRSAIKRRFADYFLWGGMPESLSLPVKRNYLSSTYQKIYLSDIATRNKISNPQLLRLLLKKLTESVKQPISYTRLSNLLSSVGGKITVPTVSSYIQYCEEAWLLLRLRNIVSAFTEKETVCKYYFIDNGLLNLSLLNGEPTLLENIVALQLFRIYGHDPENERVYFYNSHIEVDFYVPDDELAIQVSYSIGQNRDTWEREIAALKKLPSLYPCRQRLVLTYDEQQTIFDDYGEIKVMPVWKWLLG